MHVLPRCYEVLLLSCERLPTHLCDMERREGDSPVFCDTDDLPLCANTSHVLVKHYALDLSVHFHRKVISGCVVLFLEPTARGEPEGHDGEQTTSLTNNDGMDMTIKSTPKGHFTLILDCCDIAVSKVEQVNVTFLSDSFHGVQPLDLIHALVSMPSAQWRRQRELFTACSRAPGVEQDGEPLRFHTDRWSLQVWKQGVSSPQDFPRALRIYYETRPTGGSVRWTKDQDNRACVYTAGSPINNRALFPCQEPPVAMSTWQATVRAPCDFVVLMSGEEQVEPILDVDANLLMWNYYVTMPMPASTFTLAVGHWQQVATEPLPSCGKTQWERWDEFGESVPIASHQGTSSEVVKASSLHIGREEQPACPGSSSQHERVSVPDCAAILDDSFPCSHGDYPCRFAERAVKSQRVIQHRVFAPIGLLQKAQMGILTLLPQCLAAAYAILGVHPFPRLDVLIVPAGFSSLGMASPHIIFLSQSVLHVGSSFSKENSLSLCGSRLCHEIAHAWFGLVIGARDWTEEWISEGFATYLEDIIWAQAQQLSPPEAAEQSNLKALLRWRRLSDELQNSGEELQILRPNMEKTGHVSESGSSTVKHALNPDKSFLQVHYLKGYFLLRFLASEVGEQQFINFFRLFVKKYHGQLILSQDFLQMLLSTFPDLARKGVTLDAIYADWLDRPGIPKWLDERSAVWSEATLVEEVKAEVAKWILLSHQGKGRKRKRLQPKVNCKEITSEQLILLLELLLDETKLSASTMHALAHTYDLHSQDAEVRHRWCELVVKHRHAPAYGDVERFLIHDQAMGVYLYGELMVQEDAEQQALARRCLSLASEEMDRSARKVVEEMVL
ncbi:aminopeptidase O isoform X2 [Corythoichthys intestinalis]|uniref:aminopeptidase O isoform X2 n=1 Tax=Corythoichthys intestinalis TaxID=161448 RepID=UPI0025A5EBCB|nr:aminopeptidase O isoform X2 [Corythoichthys intestinalis]